MVKSALNKTTRYCCGIHDDPTEEIALESRSHHEHCVSNEVCGIFPYFKLINLNDASDRVDNRTYTPKRCRATPWETARHCGLPN